MLGTAMIDVLKNHNSIYATDVTEGFAADGVEWHLLDLLNREAVKTWIGEVRPDAVVHCAALVNVDECEKNPELAYEVHQKSTECIAKALAHWGGKLVYISTDSVFDGLKVGSYRETDSIAPPNIYARSKFAGEEEVLKYDNGVVLRTNIFGWSRAEKISFAEWVVKGLVTQSRLTMFKDVRYTPIHVSHLAEVVCRVLDKGLSGLWHATGSDSLSKYDFAMLVAEVFGLPAACVEPASVDDAGLGAKRPKNMSLDNRKLCSETGWRIPDAIDGIRLMKNQYDCGWLSAVKGRHIRSGYHFWEDRQ